MEHGSSFEFHEEESGRPAHPCIMVIFGACGDLTKRKLIPALYNLAPDFPVSADHLDVDFSPSTAPSIQNNLPHPREKFG